MSNSKIRVLLVEPNELPLELQIENTTEAQERLIGGPLEICYLNNKDSMCLLCNKNARIYNYKPNRFLTNKFIYGNFLIVGNNYDTGNVKSLTKKQVKYYQNYFGQSSIDKSNSRIVARKVVRAILKRR